MFTDGGLIQSDVFTCTSAKILLIKNKKQNEAMMTITFDVFIFIQGVEIKYCYLVIKKNL